MVLSRSGIRSLSLFVLSLPFVLLTGCTLANTATDAPIPGTAFHGSVFGGNQPVVGAHVYLMAATVSGVGSAGYGLASTSLLSAAQTGNSDSVGAYVLTNGIGAFSLNSAGPTYFYTCPSPTTQVYLYAVGGNPGAGVNSAAGFMSALGSCASLSSSTFVWMNEVTTVAAAYSLAGFATDALHISIPQYSVGTTADTLAQTDLQNAFAGVNNLVNSATGAALSTTPGTNGTPTTAQVITLANILAACVNASNASPTNCTTLLGNALSGGSSGTTPTDTATAAINIAHYPYVSSTVMSNLYALQAASGAPFANGDTSQPTDFTISITYTGGGLSGPISIAIDASGNAWVGNAVNSISEFSSSGTAISSSSGYTGGGLNYPISIAIDGSGNAWLANNSNNGTGNSISKFSSSGTAISSSSGYTGGGVNEPYAIAIDASGNAWVANLPIGSCNCISKFSSTGTAISSSSGYTGGGLNNPHSIAIDASGNAWVANGSGNSISKFSSTGTAISSSSGYTGGGLNSPQSIAIDASGNAWVANGGNSLSELSSSGTAISSSSGYTGGGLSGPLKGIAIDGSGNAWVANYSIRGNSLSEFSSSGTAISSSSGYTSGVLHSPDSIAIDGSGNVWVANQTSSSITEVVGAATPVVTPIVANLITPYTAPASKP